MANLFFPNHETYAVTSPYGLRVHPVTGVKKNHNGIDLVASDGRSHETDSVMAHTGGTVERVSYDSASGNYIRIAVAPGTLTVYCHLKNKPALKEGDTVKAGDIIGYMGSTGSATGAHLHWGIKKDGKWIDPTPYLDRPYIPAYTLEQFIREVQASCGAKVDGIAGPETLGKTVTLSRVKNPRHAAVTPVQKRLDALGYPMVGKADGIAGTKFDQAVRAYQKDHACAVDGELTAKNKTWRKLLGME